MSNPIPTLRPEPSADPLVYRPISGLAIAGLALAVVYAIIITILVISAVISRDLLLAPVWTYAVAGIAIALALVARVQIRNSEGTRTGLGLARAALWIALLPALAYWAYSFGTYLAVIRVQAERFTSTWFQDLKDGKVKDAFLLTRSPRDRSSLASDPEEFQVRCVAREGEKKGPFTQFEQHDMVRAIRDGGAAVQVDSLGIKDWEYRQGIYEVYQSFRVHTPEGVYDFVLGLRGVKEKNRLQWQITWTDKQNIVVTAIHPSDFGVAVKLWQKDGELFAQQWAQRHNMGDLASCYFMSLPIEKRPPLVTANMGRVAALILTMPSGLGAVATVAVGHALPPGPGFDAFAAGKMVACDPKTFQADNNTLKTAIPRAVREVFMSRNHLGIVPAKNVPARPHVLPDHQTIQMAIDVEVGVRTRAADGQLRPKYRCPAVLMLESKNVPVSTDHRPHWRVTGLQLVAGTQVDTPTLKLPGHKMIVPPPGTEVPPVPLPQ